MSTIQADTPAGIANSNVLCGYSAQLTGRFQFNFWQKPNQMAPDLSEHADDPGMMTFLHADYNKAINVKFCVFVCPFVCIGLHAAL